MNYQSGRQICPWPGPRPYREDEARFFCGREKELQELIDQYINQQTLTLLISASGTGKTSLLQAGLVPKLRDKREREGCDSKTGVVLILRNWGGKNPPAKMMAMAIREEIIRLDKINSGGPNDPEWYIEAGRTRLKKDIEALKKIEPSNISDTSGALEYLKKLCDCVGSLTIIVDQAEELLGSGAGRRDKDREDEVQNMFREIYNQEKRVDLVISLREEYGERLRVLDRYFKDLDKRKYHLDSMRPETVKSAIARSAKVSDFQSLLTEEVIGKIVGIATGIEMNDTASLRPVELLKLQALLLELHKYITETGKTKASAGEEKDLLEQLKESLNIENDDELVNESLQRYISDIFNSIQLTKLKDPNQDLIKRVAARFVPDLSSPAGFKRHIEIAELLQSAIKEDLTNIATRRQARGEIEGFIVRELSSAPLKDTRTLDKNLDFLFSDLADGNQKIRELRSGIAREENWSLETTARKLIKAVFDAIDLLAERNHNIIKSSGIPSEEHGDVYELVHDGFGPPLRQWADLFKKSPEDTLSSVVARRGEDFLWQKLSAEPGIGKRKLNGLCWLGCGLDYPTEISNIDFINCDFSGSIFSGCKLTNCTFTNCDFKGTLFLGGKWENVTWKECLATSVFFGKDFFGEDLEWEKVNILSSVLEQFTIDGVTPYGEITFDDCQVRLGKIVNLDFPHKSHGVIVVKNCDFYNTIFPDKDKDNWKLLHGLEPPGWKIDIPKEEYPRNAIGESIGCIRKAIRVKD